jgi:hypothetical protein
MIVMDDVSSGLDAHTENAVFHNLLGRDGILRRLNTTVIMASSRCTFEHVFLSRFPLASSSLPTLIFAPA